MDYYLVLDGRQKGPFSLEQLTDHPIPAGVVIWREGLSNWLPPLEIPEIAAKLVSRPPPLPTSWPPKPASRQTIVAEGVTPHAIAAQTTRSWPELQRIARCQRRLILGIGISGLLYVLGLPAISLFWQALGQSLRLTPDAVGTLDGLTEWMLILSLCGAQAWWAVGLARSLKQSHAWLWGLGSCVCCIGLIVLLVLNQQATSALGSAGIKVGFLGTSLPDRPPA